MNFAIAIVLRSFDEMVIADPLCLVIYELLNRTSSRIIRVTAASGLAREFLIVLPPKVKINNSTSSVYSSHTVFVKKSRLPYVKLTSWSFGSLLEDYWTRQIEELLTRISKAWSTFSLKVSELPDCFELGGGNIVVISHKSRLFWLMVTSRYAEAMVFMWSVESNAGKRVLESLKYYVRTWLQNFRSGIFL